MKYIINEKTDKRNSMLQGWKQGGGPGGYTLFPQKQYTILVLWIATYFNTICRRITCLLSMGSVKRFLSFCRKGWEFTTDYNQQMSRFSPIAFNNLASKFTILLARVAMILQTHSDDAPIRYWARQWFTKPFWSGKEILAFFLLKNEKGKVAIWNLLST